MSKIFLVKKDPAKEGQDNWITMNGAEFMAFMRTPEGASRKNNFGCIDSCGDGDSTIIIECGEEKAKSLRIEKDRRIYLQRQLEKSGFTIFSYSTICSEDGEISGEEMLRDENSEVENEVFQKLELDNLYRCMKTLPAIEQDILQMLFFTPDGMTETECAERLGIKRSAVHYHKKKALESLRVLMSEN